MLIQYIKRFFASKEYKEGFKAGREGEDSISNPYSDEATRDNWSRGMGTSPWWDTEYKPFIDWECGCRDGKQKAFDAYFNKHYK